jgi:hypothetical protein
MKRAKGAEGGKCVLHDEFFSVILLFLKDFSNNSSFDTDSH